jgi:calmodulin
MRVCFSQERFARKNEEEELRKAFERLDARGDGKIDAEELFRLFQRLDHKASKFEVEDIIWEVDDDGDKCINWTEFQAMYRRCRNDRSGYEPRRLFNVVEFLMNDKDANGTVSVEEAMQILFLRSGRGLLDSQLEEIFGTADTNSNSDLSLTGFLNSLEMSHKKQGEVVQNEFK